MAVSLVTGANGFLGRHLCRELLNRGDDVVPLVRGAAVGAEGGFVLSSKPQWSEIREAIDATGADYVYHLAGKSDASDIEVLYQANVIYAQSVLTGAAAAKSAPTVVLTGSAAEYGRPASRDMTAREGDVCRPLSAYGISKLAQTHHGFAASQTGLRVTIARLFNPIGVGSPASTALGNFVRQLSSMAASGGVLETGSLDSVRDFIDVSEAARTIALLPTLPETNGQVYNVCTGSGLRLQEIVDQLIEMSGFDVEHRLQGHRRGTSDLDIVIGSNERLRMLGVDVKTPNIRLVLSEMLSHERSKLEVR